MKKTVVGSMSEWSGVLKDFFRQIHDGSTTLEMVQAFNEHRNPFKEPNYITDWQNFYKDIGVNVDLSKVKIPKKRRGFDRLIIVAKGMAPQKLYDKCKEFFDCWKWTDKSLDEVITHSDRTAEKESYAVWFRDRIEADKELKNKSAKDLEKENISGITLTERLLYELKHFRETGKHLDIENWTLCTGSRYSDGRVPCVYWFPFYRKLRVGWCNPDDARSVLRAREAVS